MKLEDEYLRPEQATQRYGPDGRTLRKWANDGKIKTIMTPGGHRRYRAADIVTAIKYHRLRQQHWRIS